MANLISIRLNDEQERKLGDLANRFSCTPSAFVKKSLDLILEDASVVEKHFSRPSRFIQSKGDFLSEIGACPFYGAGRNTFYSFCKDGKKIFVFSTSRTLSKNESRIVTLDGTKVSDFVGICKKDEVSGFIVIRFRLSTDDEWQFFVSPLSGLSSSPFSKSSTSGNYFFHLKRAFAKDVLGNSYTLKKFLEEKL